MVWTVWQDEKLSIENQAFHKNFLFQNHAFKIFFFKIALLKMHVKRKISAFYGVKLVKTSFFVWQNVFQNLIFWKKIFPQNRAF